MYELMASTSAHHAVYSALTLAALEDSGWYRANYPNPTPTPNPTPNPHPNVLKALKGSVQGGHQGGGR
jgi:hypothetical protein